MPLCEGHSTRVEPAVNNLGNTLHLAAALGALDGDRINEGTVKLNILGTVVGHGLKLLYRAYSVTLAAGAFPDVKRSTPIAVTAYAPVLNVFKPVSEASLTDAFGDPVYCVIISDKVVSYGGHLDEPGIARIVDKRSVTTPAVRI